MHFPVLFCLSVSVKWLAVKTASEMTLIVSGGALNSTPIPTPVVVCEAVCCKEVRDLFCKERKCGGTSASSDQNGQVDVWY